MDLFENIVLCKNCQKEMKRAVILRNGFKLRALVCERCSNKIIHPKDYEDYNRFASLRQKPFKVKLRVIGNSYAVSIPKEIIDFFKLSEEMVTIALDQANKLSLMFEENLLKHKKEDNRE